MKRKLDKSSGTKGIKKNGNLITMFYSVKISKRSKRDDEVNEQEVLGESQGVQQEQLDYLGFFIRMIQEVKMFGEAVVSETENRTLRSFFELDRLSQILYVRLFMKFIKIIIY